MATLKAIKNRIDTLKAIKNKIREEASVRVLVDMIFKKQVLNVEEMKARNPSIPISLFTEDFIGSFQDVLRIKRPVVLNRWHTFFYTCYQKMLSSHEMYLTYVLFACNSEHKCNKNIFESFVSVCALVKLLCDETFQKTGVNFCDINPVIIMRVYGWQLQTLFCRHGGFQGLVEYIREHRYLTWKLNEDYFVSSDDPAALVEAIEKEKLKNELKRDLVIEKETNPDDAERDGLSIIQAKLVLSNTLVKLPTLPNDQDLLKSVMAYREKKMTKNDEEKITVTVEKLQDMKVALQGYSSLKSESKINCIVKHQDNIEQYENIIQAVIKHKYSKRSSNESPKNQISEELVGVLEHLKDKIKSLIEVLDEYDKE